MYFFLTVPPFCPFEIVSYARQEPQDLWRETGGRKGIVTVSEMPRPVSRGVFEAQ